jgi:hypothetical protein
MKNEKVTLYKVHINVFGNGGKIMGWIKKVTDVYQVIFKQNDKIVQIWFEDIFLSFHWWISVLVFIIPWIIWFEVRKKESSLRLFYSGLVLIFLNSTLESIGNPYGWWHFAPTIPYLSSFYFPTSLSTVPVLGMLILQFCKKWSPIKQAVIYSMIISFVTIPFLSWTKIYFLASQWIYFYLFPIYLTFYLIAYYFSIRNHYSMLNHKDA